MVAEDSTSQEPWSRLFAPLILGAGIVFTVLLSPLVLLTFAGGFDGGIPVPAGDPWLDINRQQAVFIFGWLAVAPVLALLARHRPVSWLAFTLVCGLVLAAGIFVGQVGYWNSEPVLFGMRMPLISGCFYGWAPGAFFLTLGGFMAWLGSAASASARVAGAAGAA